MVSMWVYGVLYAPFLIYGVWSAVYDRSHCRNKAQRGERILIVRRTQERLVKDIQGGLCKGLGRSDLETVCKHRE